MRNPRRGKGVNQTYTLQYSLLFYYVVLFTVLIVRHPCFRQGRLERGCPRPTVVSIIVYITREFFNDERLTK